jgi:hypothetical protein
MEAAAMSVVGRVRRLIGRLRLARYRRSAVTRQLLDERKETELDFAREHIIPPRPGGP